MRYFYTDALAAAWMAKHFEMKYTEQPYSHGYDICNFLSWQDSSVYDNLEKKFYIHPDSLHLLESKIGDILRLYFYAPEEDDKAGAVMTGLYAGDGEAITWFRNPRDGGIEKEVHKLADHQWRIIQRNGTPFMCPESDEV